MSHEAYGPVGYSYQADNYCLDCIPKVAAIPNTYGLDEYGRKQIMINNGGQGYKKGECNCTECRLDRMAKARGIDRYDERSFDSGDFPKSISYFNDLHAECGMAGVDENYPNGVCNSRCGRCHEVIDGVSRLHGPTICPARDNDMTRKDT